MKDDSLVGAGILLVAGASVAAVFGWVGIIFYLSGVVSAVTAGAVIAGSGLESEEAP